MDATLVLSSLAQAYSDTPQTSSPAMKTVDWGSTVCVPVSNAKSLPYTVAPGDTVTAFSGVRSTSIDNSTQLTLALSSLDSDRYRFTATSGTAPALRTDRALTLATRSVTITSNANQTATIASTSGSFTAVQVGDVVLIPGTSTGDSAGPFNVINEGYWTVLAVAGDGSSIQVTRPTGTSFAAWTETQTVSANSQLVAYSASGVQVGDAVMLSAGFAASVLGQYTLVAVTPSWFEVVSTKALPVSAVATPGTTGIQFYSAAKRYLRILADQPCVPRLNGDSGSTNAMAPWLPGDIRQAAEFVKVGPTWSLTIQNTSQSVANILVIAAE